jgi:hypothetical protein
MPTNCQILRRAKNLTLCRGFFMTLRRPMFCNFLLTLCRFLNDFMSARCSVIFFLNFGRPIKMNLCRTDVKSYFMLLRLG